MKIPALYKDDFVKIAGLWGAGYGLAAIPVNGSYQRFKTQFDSNGEFYITDDIDNFKLSMIQDKTEVN